jgi:nucleotide-binding universal stress UspA family protein
MKAVIGIDPAEHFRPALNLFLRLRFDRPEATLMFSCESLVPDGSFPPFRAEHPMADILRDREASGVQLAQEVQAELRQHGFSAELVTRRGDPMQRLIEVADETGAELIVAGSARKPQWESLFFGSVSKGLVTASHQSILIGKRQPNEGEGLTAVLATDHSPYADRAVGRLIDAHPTGIERIIVLTAVDPRTQPDLLLIEDVPDSPEQAQQWATERLSEQNEELRTRLLRICSNIETRVLFEHTPNAIRMAMEEFDADLLIVGAHGHGFIERLALGSVSFHQVVNTPHNVLVVRARE